VSCAKTAEPIDLPFELWTGVGRNKHKFNHIRQVAPMCPSILTWRIRLNRPSPSAMRPYVILFWPIVIIIIIIVNSTSWRDGLGVYTITFGTTKPSRASVLVIIIIRLTRVMFDSCLSFCWQNNSKGCRWWIFIKFWERVLWSREAWVKFWKWFEI